MEKYIHSFQEFLNEGKVTVKRQYTESYPKKEVSTYAPVRAKVLSFIKEKNHVSHEDLIEFFKGVNEDSSPDASRKWLTKNKQYFKVIEKEGKKMYTLSQYGERVYKATQEINKG
jgi:hypothetical protein